MQELKRLLKQRQNSISGKIHSKSFRLPYFLWITIPIILLGLSGCMTLSSSGYGTHQSKNEMNPFEIDSFRKGRAGKTGYETMDAGYPAAFSFMLDLKHEFHTFSHHRL